MFLVEYNANLFVRIFRYLQTCVRLATTTTTKMNIMKYTRHVFIEWKFPKLNVTQSFTDNLNSKWCLIVLRMTIRFSTTITTATTKCNPTEWVQWTKPISPLANAFIHVESFNQFKMFSNSSNNNNSNRLFLAWTVQVQKRGMPARDVFLEEQEERRIKQGHLYETHPLFYAKFWANFLDWSQQVKITLLITVNTLY